MTSYEPAMIFPYTLDLFQQQSVEAIERDENVLVTASHFQLEKAQ